MEIGNNYAIFVSWLNDWIMCRQQEEDKTHKEKQFEDGLRSIVNAQLEAHELWEIDECVRILFELSHEE